jgi:hypothetical protein
MKLSEEACITTSANKKHHAPFCEAERIAANFIVNYPKASVHVEQVRQNSSFYHVRIVDADGTVYYVW